MIETGFGEKEKLQLFRQRLNDFGISFQNNECFSTDATAG